MEGFGPGGAYVRHPINLRVLSHPAAPMQMENRRVFKLIVFAPAVVRMHSGTK